MQILVSEDKNKEKQDFAHCGSISPPLPPHLMINTMDENIHPDVIENADASKFPKMGSLKMHHLFQTLLQRVVLTGLRMCLPNG